MALSAVGGLAEDAAACIEQGARPNEGIRGVQQEISQQEILIQWAEKRSVLVETVCLDGLEQHSIESTEHEVFYRESDHRAVKITRRGRYGNTIGAQGRFRNATPLEYLTRILLANHLFRVDWRLEGVVRNGPRMITSQEWIDAMNEELPHPTENEICRLMQSLNFVQDQDSALRWRRDDVVVADTKPENFIRSARGIIPIDLIIGLGAQPQG